MDNFLTSLYSKYFLSIDEEKKHRAIHDFPDENSAIRNDEKILAAQKKTELLRDLITEYTKGIN